MFDTKKGRLQEWRTWVEKEILYLARIKGTPLNDEYAKGNAPDLPTHVASLERRIDELEKRHDRPTPFTAEDFTGSHNV